MEKKNGLTASKNLRASGFAIVHQEVPLCLNMSIAQNIFLGSKESTKGIFMDEKYMNKKTEELLEQFQLKAKATELLGKYLASLSSPWCRLPKLSTPNLKF